MCFLHPSIFFPLSSSRVAFLSVTLLHLLKQEMAREIGTFVFMNCVPFIQFCGKTNLRKLCRKNGNKKTMHFCLQVSPGYTDKNISYVLQGICEGLKAVDKWLIL